VVPGGEPHQIGLVRLGGELVDAGEHVGEVPEVVEVAVRVGPPLQEAHPRLADRLRLSRCPCSRDRPLPCSDQP